MPNTIFRSGFVAFLGEPNVGKSTLLNAILDFKVAIVSPKPQTTRDKIHGIYNDECCQIVFSDTPGVMEPHDRLNVCLRDRALEALGGADVVYHMVDAKGIHALPEAAEEALAHVKKTLFLVVNKCDEVEPFKTSLSVEEMPLLIDMPLDIKRYDRIFLVSALKRINLEALLAATRELLPEGPPLYDPEQMTDRDMRFLAAEIVREKVLANTEKEVPYSVATKTELFMEDRGEKHFVRVIIHVEHDSQKAILIGEGGRMLKKIGSEARPEIEAMADHPVFLELWVRVTKNWRKNDNALREFGYYEKAKKRRGQR
jgi:GTPase